MVAALTGAAGCGSQGDALTRPPVAAATGGEAATMRDYTSRPTAPAEEALIRRILAAYRGSDAVVMEEMLRDQRAPELGTSNMALRPLFDSLNATRHALRTAAATSSKARLDSLRATVVLLDHLPDSGATAVVVRRHGNPPRDFILLASGRATAAELGPAVLALVKLRRSTGSPGSTGVKIVVRGRGVPSRWGRTLIDQAERDLLALRSRRIEAVDGIGRGRQFDIYVGK